MGYKMVFSDMDGTLLWKGLHISVENRKAICKAVDKGIDFVICTGRGVFGVEPHLRELGLIGKKGYAICQNGAAIYDLMDMKLVLKRSFSPNMLKPVADYARTFEEIENFYYDDRTFLCEKLTPVVEEYCQVMKTTPRLVKDPTEYEGELTKCLFSGPRKHLEKIKAYAEELLGDQVNLFYSAENYLEFVTSGVDKGTALEAAAKEAGVDLKDTIAIGDSDNDLPMIRKAGLGVAMKNGEDHVKAAAAYVTERDAEENGVAEVLELFL
ncbi:MAG: Cof-type HAD-IIB family hydrolase [Bacillota bacterium]|nr:Cof-type HAD-IIB family hydrolase [Bacillota bacterium]